MNIDLFEDESHEDMVLIARFLIEVESIEAEQVIDVFDKPHHYHKRYITLARLHAEDRKEYTVQCDHCGATKTVPADEIDWTDGECNTECQRCEVYPKIKELN